MLFKVNVVLFTFDALAGGIIALRKSVVITVKVEIGGAAAQIECLSLSPSLVCLECASGSLCILPAPFFPSSSPSRRALFFHCHSVPKPCPSR